MTEPKMLTRYIIQMGDWPVSELDIDGLEHLRTLAKDGTLCRDFDADMEFLRRTEDDVVVATGNVYTDHAEHAATVVQTLKERLQMECYPACIAKLDIRIVFLGSILK